MQSLAASRRACRTRIARPLWASSAAIPSSARGETYVSRHSASSASADRSSRVGRDANHLSRTDDRRPVGRVLNQLPLRHTWSMRQIGWVGGIASLVVLAVSRLARFNRSRQHPLRIHRSRARSPRFPPPAPTRRASPRLPLGRSRRSSRRLRHWSSVTSRDWVSAAMACWS